MAEDETPSVPPDTPQEGATGEDPPPPERKARIPKSVKKERRRERHIEKLAVKKQAGRFAKQKRFDTLLAEYNSLPADATERRRAVARVLKSFGWKDPHHPDPPSEVTKRKLAERTATRARLRYAMENPAQAVGVCLDLDYSHLMDERQYKSLKHQVGYCYAAASRAREPVHLQLLGLKEHNSFTESIRHLTGYDAWVCTKSPLTLGEYYTDAEARRRVVYLSADAEEELTSVEKGMVYVVGGLIDRNRHKGVCHRKAETLGIRTARLPIKAMNIEMTATHVLTVNQVVDMLVDLYEKGSKVEGIGENRARALREVMREVLTAFIPTRKVGGKEEGEDQDDKVQDHGG